MNLKRELKAGGGAGAAAGVSTDGGATVESQKRIESKYRKAFGLRTEMFDKS